MKPALHVCVAFFLLFGLATLPLEAKNQGSCNAKQLTAEHVDVVEPSFTPQGFKQTAISFDCVNKKYQITYTGPGGAYFIFEGQQAPGQAAAPEPQATHKPSIVQSFSKSVNNLFGHHSAANSNTGTKPEEEINPSELTVPAHSAVLGNTEFKPAQPDTRSCVAGDAYHKAARYTLSGCRVDPDLMVKVYGSAKRIGS